MLALNVEFGASVIIKLWMQPDDMPLDISLVACDEIARGQWACKRWQQVTFVGPQVHKHSSNSREPGRTPWTNGCWSWYWRDCGGDRFNSILTAVHGYRYDWRNTYEVGEDHPSSLVANRFCPNSNSRQYTEKECQQLVSLSGSTILY